MSTGDMTQVRFLHDLTFQLATKIPKAIIMPDDVAAEKVLALQALGAEVERVRPSSIVDKKQYVNLAKDRAASFGKKNEININGHILKDDHPEIFHSPSNTVIVTMPHDHPESNSSHERNHIDMDGSKALNEPRGFFADQFEVSFYLWRSCCLSGI
jgi:cysteine synthase A